MPVIDYEPPTCNVPRCLPSSHAALALVGGRPTPGPPVRSRPIDGQGTAVTSTPLSPQLREAAAFADAALRRLLEVIDRRRPAAQLRSVLAPGLVDPVLAACRSAAGQPGAAVLRRIRLQAAGGTVADNAPDSAAEVFGTFSRGDRIHAIACRVEHLPTSQRWLVVALHVG
jgi:hypothetical protein